MYSASNATVALCRELSATGGAKQPGRRYGPAPKKPRGPGAKPMSKFRRLDIYTANQTRSLTPRQHRQYERKHGLRGVFAGKNRPTPQRPKRGTR